MVGANLNAAAYEAVFELRKEPIMAKIRRKHPLSMQKGFKNGTLRGVRCEARLNYGGITNIYSSVAFSMPTAFFIFYAR